MVGLVWIRIDITFRQRCTPLIWIHLDTVWIYLTFYKGFWRLFYFVLNCQIISSNRFWFFSHLTYWKEKHQNRFPIFIEKGKKKNSRGSNNYDVTFQNTPHRTIHSWDDNLIDQFLFREKKKRSDDDESLKLAWLFGFN